jgi:ankyrin repeat protein
MKIKKTVVFLLTLALTMKSQLIAIVAAVLIVGCGEAQSPEPPTAKAPDISIHKAAIIGNTEAIQQHLAAGTDVNAKAGGGDTPLDWAIMGKRTGAADLLRKHGGMMVEELRSGMTPLHAAARKGLKEVVELLIHEGADVNAKDDDGDTPLDLALSAWEDDSPEVKAAKKEIANLLRKHGGKTGDELKAEGK